MADKHKNRRKDPCLISSFLEFGIRTRALYSHRPKQDNDNVDVRSIQIVLKIATYNVNSIRVRLETVMGWLEKNKPEVLCIQETKCQDDAFPALVLQTTGYHLYHRGMKSYNGVA